MIVTPDIKGKFDASYKLLMEDTTSREKFESIRKLIQGFHPRIDKQLTVVSKALSTYYKLQTGDVIQLTAESLPETTEEDKKRKRALLLFIQSWRQLQGEVQRVQHELESNDQKDAKNSRSSQQQIVHVAKIIKYAKGPFGIITLAAVVIVGVSLFLNSKNSSIKTSTPVLSPTQAIPTHGPKIQVIIFNGKQIPLSQLYIGHVHLPNCDSPHYHAINGIATALDGTVLQDPGNCGFGKVKDVPVVDVE